MVRVDCKGRFLVKISDLHAKDIDQARQKAIVLARSQREISGFGRNISVPVVMMQKNGNTYEGTVGIETRSKTKQYREVLY